MGILRNYEKCILVRLLRFKFNGVSWSRLNVIVVYRTVQFILFNYVPIGMCWTFQVLKIFIFHGLMNLFHHFCIRLYCVWTLILGGITQKHKWCLSLVTQVHLRIDMLNLHTGVRSDSSVQTWACWDYPESRSFIKVVIILWRTFTVILYNVVSLVIQIFKVLLNSIDRLIWHLSKIFSNQMWCQT